MTFLNTRTEFLFFKSAYSPILLRQEFLLHISKIGKVQIVHIQENIFMKSAYISNQSPLENGKNDKKTIHKYPWNVS